MLSMIVRCKNFGGLIVSNYIPVSYQIARTAVRALAIYALKDILEDIKEYSTKYTEIKNVSEILKNIYPIIESNPYAFFQTLHIWVTLDGKQDTIYLPPKTAYLLYSIGLTYHMKEQETRQIIR
jgi:hypothetical protein